MRALAITVAVLAAFAGCAAFGSSNGAGEEDRNDAAAEDGNADHADNADGASAQDGGGLDDGTPATDAGAPDAVQGNALSDSGVPLNCATLPSLGTLLFCNDFDQHDGGETPYLENPAGGTALSIVHYVSGPNALAPTLGGNTLKAYATIGNDNAGDAWDISFDVWLDDVPVGVTFAQLYAGVSSVTLATLAGHVVKVDIFDAKSGAPNSFMQSFAAGWVHVDAQLVTVSGSGNVTVRVNGTAGSAPFTGAPQLSLSLGVLAGGTATTHVWFDDVLATGP